MDAQIKEGHLYMQYHKIVKKWRRCWVVLFADSSSGVARLEVFEGERPSSGGGGRRADRKVIRLSECVTVLATPTEPGPPEGPASFCVRTDERAYLFAGDAWDCTGWVQSICQIAFKGNMESQQPKMEDNLIYESREEGQEFRVSVRCTEAAQRCGLHGEHWLSIGSHALTLCNCHTHSTMVTWPYKLLRRYGHDKGAFSVEAGRRCESGPGSFIFDTPQGGQIFARVEAAIREQRALVEEEGPERGGRSPVPPDSAALLDDPEAVYSQPFDCVDRPTDPPDAVYSQPVDHVTPTPAPQPHPPAPRHLHGDMADPLYSEVYDRVGQEGAPGPICSSKPERQGALRGSPKSLRAPGHSQDPDDIASLYSQVKKPAHLPPPSAWGPDADDVIYENLGVI
ncbi:hypothetical protein AGOR_G00195300 [Albula goreensis]|uniref:IRS-type PTB domain-containing protein n=1 Tax=Albula goreensis TaxID=1534307 RepID=A0A8T3CZA3_9TELE|nr:hypothetical protein AGOR_G00195300 [Albula goreensis]